MFLIMYNENVYINIIYFYLLILYIFIYFIYYFFKDYYIVFVLLKKNEKGLRGKQQFEQFTQS